ncbi:hypothetical protein M758_8G010400 [Ceratodon purpureus]|uniref:Protein kinase domain-containing protein n=1 Tax=Ceratodon purpureus TaxID=3225 RepID=A0A8T0GY74_CERPU|nr:hypothetical protein KC19_8G011100 [Ceratodon purpureus]KAG0607222.1 hypothetical protein M758_8G010400 [Ceratodon purpureus]
MDTKIEVVLDIIKSVTALDGRFQINQHQCKRLAGFFSRAGKFFHPLKEYFNDADYKLPSLDVTISVLQKGQLLVEKYSKEDWFESMVTAGVNQDSFVAIHVELESCIRPIYEVAKHRLASEVHGVPFVKLRSVAPLLFLDEDDRATLFKGDAEKDKKHMLKRIESKRIMTSKARNSDLTTEQKSYEIRSLDMASEKISELTVEQERVGIQKGLRSYLPRKKKLPSYLRIESSEIEVLDLIGSGGSAEVYKCRWLHRDYAVKIFKANDVDSLRKEVENLIPLRHPNIVLLVGFSIRKFDSSPMVVMELLDCDLHTLVHTNDIVVAPKMKLKRLRSTTTFHSKQLDPFPIRLAVDFIYQIATGMTYLHKRKLFHGDLKALNVLVKCHQAGWELKISDFGVSDELVLKEDHVGYESDCTSFSTANVGTTRWRAPEVFDVTGGGVPKPYSMKADVYSFSMTCVEILTRQVPYHGMLTTDIKKHVKAGGRPELPSNVPKDLRNLIVRCWDKDPTRRPDFSEICTCMQGLKEHSLVFNMEEMGVVPEDFPRVVYNSCSIL